MFRVVQRNPRLFHGMVLLGPLIKSCEEIPPLQMYAVRLANYIAPNFEAISFPLVRIKLISYGKVQYSYLNLHKNCHVPILTLARQAHC